MRKSILKQKNQPLGSQIFKKLKLKLPKNINKKEEIGDYFKIKKKKTWGQLSTFFGIKNGLK